MLEGLEISEFFISELNPDKRIDAEYYDKLSQKTKTLIQAKEFSLLGDLAFSITDMGAFSLYKSEYFVESGVPFLRVNNIKDNYLDMSELLYISKDYHDQLKKSQVKARDVLLTTKAIIGIACTVSNDVSECNMSQNLVRISLNENKINPYYLSTFLNCNFGRVQTVKAASGNVQLYLNFEKIKALKIPNFGSDFQKQIGILVNEADGFRASSKSTYDNAEQTLLEAVGLADFKPSIQNSNIKTLDKSFGTSGRLDAEYYQPKYEEVMARIVSQAHAKLVDVVTIKKSIEPGSNAYADIGLPFIRVSDFSKNGLTTPDKCLSDQYVEANQKLLNSLKPKQNTILFSKDGSVGSAYLLREDLHGVTSGAILHLRLKRNDVLPEYLTLVLNSKLVQMQAERDAGGSIILHWRVGEIENVLLPIIDLATQTKISKLVQESFTLKAQSEHLLNVTKRAVEIAIEQDESAAMQYINLEIKA